MSKYKGFADLRGAVDGKDNFVSGHQVISTAGATRHAARMKKVPVWALDDEVLRKLILTRFPKAATDPEERAKAARLLRIIHMYYRQGLTAQVIADELGMDHAAVEMAVSRWNRKQGTSRGPSKRPKKNSVGIGTTNEVTL